MKTIVPAQPGWSLLTPIHRNGTEGLEIYAVNDEPVIAWHIYTFNPDPADSVPQHQVTPITVEMQNKDCAPILRAPDGDTFEVGVMGFGRISERDLRHNNELIERFKQLQQLGQKAVQPTEPPSPISREDAVGLLKEALARIEHPQQNANGGDMQASGAYWRCARVVRDFLLPKMKQAHPEEHWQFILDTHGTMTPSK